MEPKKRARCHLGEFILDLEVDNITSMLFIPFVDIGGVCAETGLRNEVGFEFDGYDVDGALRYVSDLTKFMLWFQDTARWIAAQSLALQTEAPRA